MSYCRLILLSLLIFAAVLFSSASDQTGKQPHQRNVGKPSRLRVDSGTLFTFDGVPIELRGVMATIQKRSSKPQPQGKEDDDGGDAPARGESRSELVTIDSGRVLVSDESLTKLMNEKISKNGKVYDLKLTADKNQLKITGKAKKVIDVPFTLEGPVKPTPDGQIELDAKSVKAADIPGLAQLFGFTVQKAVGTKAAKGVHAEQNTIIFDPDKLWGLPVHGKVTGVQLQPHGVVLVFGSQQQNSPNGKVARSAAKRPVKAAK